MLEHSKEQRRSPHLRDCQHNRTHIGGKVRAARAGLSIPVFPLPPKSPAAPLDNAFTQNHFDDFTASVADIFVGANAVGTGITGHATIVDNGTGTVVQP